MSLSQWGSQESRLRVVEDLPSSHIMGCHLCSVIPSSDLLKKQFIFVGFFSILKPFVWFLVSALEHVPGFPLMALFVSCFLEWFSLCFLAVGCTLQPAPRLVFKECGVGNPSLP